MTRTQLLITLLMINDRFITIFNLWNKPQFGFHFLMNSYKYPQSANKLEFNMACSTIYYALEFRVSIILTLLVPVVKLS